MADIDSQYSLQKRKKNDCVLGYICLRYKLDDAYLVNDPSSLTCNSRRCSFQDDFYSKSWAFACQFIQQMAIFSLIVWFMLLFQNITRHSTLFFFKFVPYRIQSRLLIDTVFPKFNIDNKFRFIIFARLSKTNSIIKN